MMLPPEDHVGKAYDIDHQYEMCPFYILPPSTSNPTHNAKEIRCEGIIPGTSIRTHFMRKSDRTFQQKVFCRKEYKSCEIYRAIMRYKYGEDDGT